MALLCGHCGLKATTNSASLMQGQSCAQTFLCPDTPDTRKAEPVFDLTVRCDCGHTIRLPVTKPPQEVIRQLPLTTGGLPKNVLCHHCNRVSAYSPDKFHKKSFQRTVRDQLRGDQACVCIRTKCGEQDCEFRVNIRIRMRVSRSQDMREEALSMLGKATVSSVVCESGHHRNAFRDVLAVLVDPGREGLDWDSIPEE